MDIDKYATYTLEDFITDPLFRQAVRREPGADHGLPQRLVERYPQQQTTIEEARQVILGLDAYASRRQLSAEARTQLLGRIMRPRATGHTPSGKRNGRSFRLWPLGAAAAVLLLLVLGIAYLKPFAEPTSILHATAFAEQKNIDLPDGSLVRLNANSTLRLPAAWPDGADREVWLEGEAYFEVRPIASKRTKFTVHTKNLDVDVLGTQFNVSTYTPTTRVTLEEGSIRLRLKQSDRQREVVMESGQIAEYRAHQELRIQAVDRPQRYSSWKDGYIQLEGMSFLEMEQILEQTYGIELTIRRPQLYERELRGALPAQNLPELIETLETLLDLHIEQIDNELILP